MNPQDVSKIAEAVVKGLTSGANPGLLGCGDISSTTAYSAEQQTGCQYYSCGGAGLFSCCVGFNCFQDFACPGAAPFSCSSQASFGCTVHFECGTPYAITPSACPQSG